MQVSPIIMGEGINEVKINKFFFLVYVAARWTVTSVLGMFHGRVICKPPEMQIPAAPLSISSCGPGSPTESCGKVSWL